MYSFGIQQNKPLSHLTCLKHILHHVYSSTPPEASRQLLPSLVTTLLLRDTHGAQLPLCCLLPKLYTLPPLIPEPGNRDSTLPLASALGDVSTDCRASQHASLLFSSGLLRSSQPPPLAAPWASPSP